MLVIVVVVEITDVVDDVANVADDDDFAEPPINLDDIAEANDVGFIEEERDAVD